MRWSGVLKGMLQGSRNQERRYSRWQENSLRFLVMGSTLAVCALNSDFTRVDSHFPCFSIWGLPKNSRKHILLNGRGTTVSTSDWFWLPQDRTLSVWSGGSLLPWFSKRHHKSLYNKVFVTICALKCVYSLSLTSSFRDAHCRYIKTRSTRFHNQFGICLHKATKSKGIFLELSTPLY